MKRKFPLYYRLSEDEKKKLFEDKNCYFVFDTNALLDIYRLGKDTAEKVLKVVETLKERIVIPYHVAFEYHKRMMDIITDLYSSYNNFRKETDKNQLLKSLSDKLELNRFPSIKRKFQDHIGTALDNFLKDIEAEEQYIKKQYQGWELQHKISTALGDLILDGFNENEIKEIEEEGAKRYDSCIPPGYKDKSSKTENIYGDLIIWKEILRFSESKQCSIIFVSRDFKEDWIQKEHGLVCGPRLELLEEFQEISSGTFYMYNLNQFLEYANSGIDLLGEPELSEIKDVTSPKHEKPIIAKNSQPTTMEKGIPSEIEKKCLDKSSKTLKVTMVDNNKVTPIE